MRGRNGLIDLVLIDVRIMDAASRHHMLVESEVKSLIHTDIDGITVKHHRS